MGNILCLAPCILSLTEKESIIQRSREVTPNINTYNSICGGSQELKLSSTLIEGTLINNNKLLVKEQSNVNDSVDNNNTGTGNKTDFTNVDAMILNHNINSSIGNCNRYVVLLCLILFILL